MLSTYREHYKNKMEIEADAVLKGEPPLWIFAARVATKWINE